MAKGKKSGAGGKPSVGKIATKAPKKKKKKGKPEEAARLGKDLTPMGAEMAGNADGSIPAWNAEGTPIPDSFVPGSDNYVDPYAGEKPLYTIDNSNWREYEEFLTEGTKAIFEKYGACIDRRRADASELARAVETGHRVQRIDGITRRRRDVQTEAAGAHEIEISELDSCEESVLFAVQVGVDPCRKAIAQKILIMCDEEVAIVALNHIELRAHVDDGGAEDVALGVSPVSIGIEAIHRIPELDVFGGAPAQVGSQQQLI